MHECTSIIINSFHLFQQAKGFKVTHIGKGGRPPSNNFLQLPRIKAEVPFHELIPRKSTINDNLKSS